MSKVIHYLARQQAHTFFEAQWHDLPTFWHDDMESAQFEFELWLATFDVKRHEENLTGYELLKAAQLRAQRYYRRELQQPHHGPAEWAYFRYQLERALLKTVAAEPMLQLTASRWNDLLIELSMQFSGIDKEGMWLLKTS